MAGNIFTSKQWGNFALHSGDLTSVTERRTELSATLNLKRIQFMNQSHSNVVQVVTAFSRGVIDADGLVTNEKNVGLAVMVADCIPLLLTAKESVGAIHVGRVGMVSGIVSIAVARMRELGATQILAAVGPAICANCYEVSPKIYAEAIQLVPGSATSVVKHQLNLRSGVESQLRDFGIRVANWGSCTSENNEYFSHRRDSLSGRQVGVVWL